MSEWVNGRMDEWMNAGYDEILMKNANSFFWSNFAFAFLRLFVFHCSLSPFIFPCLQVCFSFLFSESFIVSLVTYFKFCVHSCITLLFIIKFCFLCSIFGDGACQVAEKRRGEGERECLPMFWCDAYPIHSFLTCSVIFQFGNDKLNVILITVSYRLWLMMNPFCSILLLGWGYHFSASNCLCLCYSTQKVC